MESEEEKPNIQLSNSNQYNLFDRIEAVLNFINHLLIFFISIYMTYFCFKAGLVNTSLHAWTVILGYQLLMAEAILTFYSSNLWSMMFLNSRQAKTTLHWSLMLIGSAFAVFGSFYKIIMKGPYFYSIHSITGLIATILLLINLFTGLFANYSQRLRNNITPLYNKTFHIFFGLLTFIIGMVSMYYGYNTGFLRKRLDDEFLGVLKAITVITILLTIIGPMRTLYRNSKIIMIN